MRRGRCWRRSPWPLRSARSRWRSWESQRLPSSKARSYWWAARRSRGKAAESRLAVRKWKCSYLIHQNTEIWFQYILVDYRRSFWKKLCLSVQKMRTMQDMARENQQKWRMTQCIPVNLKFAVQVMTNIYRSTATARRSPAIFRAKPQPSSLQLLMDVKTSLAKLTLNEIDQAGVWFGTVYREPAAEWFNSRSVCERYRLDHGIDLYEGLYCFSKPGLEGLYVLRVTKECL